MKKSWKKFTMKQRKQKVACRDQQKFTYGNKNDDIDGFGHFNFG